MAIEPVGLDSLPNEIIIHILTTFPTRTLLLLTTTSPRFYDLILRILHHRLLSTASIKNHNLILECYHPTAKLSTPGLPCDYLYTDSLSQSSLSALPSNVPRHMKLGELSRVYSHFRPQVSESEPRPRRSHLAGFAPLPEEAESSTEEEKDRDPEAPTQLITLESHELFSQLVTVVNLVKVGPKRGLFLSCVTIGEGVLRIWRDWLATHSCLSGTKFLSGAKYSVSEGCLGSQDDTFRPEEPTVREGIVEKDEENNEKRILWLDREKNVGVKLRVVEREDLNTIPLIRGRDEDVAVVWEIIYEELFIRTTQLLLNVEESLQQENNHSGKAIVIGSW